MLNNVATVKQRTDAIALTLGSKLTVSSLMIACVLAIVLGAASILDSMKSMDRDLKVMSGQMAEADEGLTTLNGIMNSLPPTVEHMKVSLAMVGDTAVEVKKSSKGIALMNGQTTKLNVAMTDIAKSTTSMRGSMESVEGKTGKLDSTITLLNGKITPLVETQAGMLGSIRDMRGGMEGMNASLAYTIRTLNYITAPPTGGPFTVRVDLDPKALPPIPGLKAETEPVEVYPRYVFGPPYTGR